MNIFVLDQNIDKSVEYYFDKHVVKMVTESAQLLSSAVRMSGIDAGYKLTHKNHPCAIWARESLSNWQYLLELTRAMNDEYRYRLRNNTPVSFSKLDRPAEFYYWNSILVNETSQT